jgi:rRNA-processing protein CGR1
VEKDAVTNEDDVMGEDNEGNRTGNKRVKRTTRQNSVGAGKVSGRSWKVPGEKMSGLRSGSSKKLSTSWEKKMKEKAEMKDLRERKKMALEEKKAAARAAREQREEAKKRKEENRKKSVVTTVVSSATARRMAKSKKQRKKLVTVEG